MILNDYKKYGIYLIYLTFTAIGNIFLRVVMKYMTNQIFDKIKLFKLVVFKFNTFAKQLN